MRLPRSEQLAQLSALCMSNAKALFQALEFCAANGIGSFRILSSILPVKTHPVVGYHIEELPGASSIIAQFRLSGAFAKEKGIRTGFHPDQFVVLSSLDEGIISRSVADIEWQAEVAEWTGADTVNIHGGGAYGDKAMALERFARNLEKLSPRARCRLTVENDDKTFTPADLIPVCRRENLPFVYDAHHHRCHPDGIGIEETTEAARATWGGRATFGDLPWKDEPLFHLSSPLEGWKGSKPERHHDYITPDDFPAPWLGWPLTVEVEAKAKELAVLQLKGALLAK
jgi:UV DNA damage endonuclease